MGILFSCCRKSKHAGAEYKKLDESPKCATDLEAHAAAEGVALGLGHVLEELEASGELHDVFHVLVGSLPGLLLQRWGNARAVSTS